MSRNIAIALSLVVVLGAFFPALYPREIPSGEPREVILSNFSFPSALKIPTLENSAVATVAWRTFDKYREYLREHNLEGIRSLSHQLSATCQDPAQRAECERLMDSAYFFTEDLKPSDFKNVYADSRQIVLLTDPIKFEAESGLVQTAIIFTRDELKKPKLLGVRFCAADNPIPTNCVNTDPATRDADNDGWWDDVEAQFR